MFFRNIFLILTIFIVIVFTINIDIIQHRRSHKYYKIEKGGNTSVWYQTR
jgi:hypothetical protein